MSSIYIHIPYCKQACSYCNFHFQTSSKDKQEMLDCIRRELESRKSYLDSQIIETIYFGGGTPSLLAQEDISRILRIISDHYSLSSNLVITFECNPDDLYKDKLLQLKEVGINRLSIGVQSFNDKDLRWMNRSHNADQSESSIKMAQELGFENISIDLIYGLPNQTLDDWEDNLRKLFNYNINHFSSYILTIENKTALKYLVEKKKIHPPKDSLVIDQFNLLINSARSNGFIHYEISNFGKEGYFSSHNIGYWKNQNYLGIGPSAHSFNGHSRRWNISSTKRYIQKIINGEDYFEIERLNKEQKYNEYIFTALRTIWGVDSKQISSRFSKRFLDNYLVEIVKWKAKGYIKQEGNIYTLTRTGLVFADNIASDLFIVD